ncbi:MAG: sigma factor-like helix-turn-helix DNA-binding protein, partial [Bacteroidota bacterium]
LSLLVGDQVQSHEEIQIENEWKAEFQKMAMDSFQQLSPSCQKVLKLFYVEKWSMEEIAQELNLSDANSAKTKKSRCFKKWDQLVEGIKLKKTL